MQTIKKIAGVELYQLFYSPIGWILIAILTIQCGITYHNYIDDTVIMQDLHYELPPLTSWILGSSQGAFNQIVLKLFLFLPLITMGLLSREINSGTIKLLYSSPISIRSIVLGKFLAMMVYNLILLAVISSLAVVAVIHIQSADVGMLLSGLLGIYLLLCAYSAIGLFMSSLTSYQVVAAICTISVLAVLSYIGSVWQDIDFVRDLTYFLSISGRTEKLISGLISTKDVFYFILIILLFLTYTVFHLWTKRKTSSWLFRFNWYVIIMAGTLALGYLSSRPRFTFYYDATAVKAHTISKINQQLLANTGDQELKVTNFVNLLNDTYVSGQPRQRNNDLSRWEQYIRFKSNTTVDYVYYYDKNIVGSHRADSLREMAQSAARSFRTILSRFKSPDEVNEIDELREEGDRYVSRLSLGNKHTYLRLFGDMLVYPSEREVGAAVKRLIVPVPVVAFLQSEHERAISKSGDRDYKLTTRQLNYRYALINQGFDVITVDPGSPIPDSLTTLFIGDPRVPFAPGALANIQSYIDRGGNLVIAGEPDKQEILNPLLKSLGISLESGTVVQPHANHAPSLILARVTGQAGRYNHQWNDLNQQKSIVSMPGAAALSYSDSGSFTITPLLYTGDSLSWNKKGPFSIDSIQIAFDPDKGDIKGPLVTAVLAERTVRGKAQHIIVTGDADLFSNTEITRKNMATENQAFVLSLFYWLSDGKFPLDIVTPKNPDMLLKFTEDAKINKLKMVQLGILPGAVVIFSTILLIRRRRK